MIPKDLDIHIFDRPETELERITCAQLRLSNQWRVTGKTILNGSGEEVSDDHPDIPEPVGSGHLSGGTSEKGFFRIEG